MNSAPAMHKNSYSLTGGILRIDRVPTLLGLWQRRREERQQLRTLPDHMLQDIGLTPEAVRKEVAKPFWRA